MLYLQPKEQKMKEYFKILTKCPLFFQFNEAMMAAFLEESDAKIQSYNKGAALVLHGDPSQQIGILLSGIAQIRQTDYAGNSVLLHQILPGMLFGEAFTCAGHPFTVSVSAVKDSAVLWIDYQKIQYGFQNQSQTAVHVLSNLLRFLAEKNIFFTERIRHLSKRSLREKVLSYLSGQSALQNSLSFSIPLNRQELADYLAADRSALSAVLSKLQNEGVLTFHKNHFTLTKSAD